MDNIYSFLCENITLVTILKTVLQIIMSKYFKTCQCQFLRYCRIIASHDYTVLSGNFQVTKFSRWLVLKIFTDKFLRIANNFPIIIIW